MHLPDIRPLDPAQRARLAHVLDGKAKPRGAFGRLEQLAVEIGLIMGSRTPALGRARLLVLAGDHGLVSEGIAAYPQSVTFEIARLVLGGRAGANVCAAAAGADVFLVDAGLLRPLDPHPHLVDRRIAPGTRNSRRGPAMTEAQRDEAFDAGIALAVAAIEEGCDILALGEIGIGNSSAAALLAHVATGLPLDGLVGPGAGVPPGGLEQKRLVLAQVYARAPTRSVPEALAEFAGFEMVMLTGAMLGAAARNRIVIVDGFIATACAAAAAALRPAARERMVFAHTSAEPGHRALLAHLAAQPLLDLGMRLGEGTGAALAIPLVRAAAGLLTNLADLPGAHPP